MVSGAVNSWQATEMEVRSHIFVMNGMEGRSWSALFRCGYAISIPSIALYESWKLIVDGAEGFISVIIRELIARAFNPFFSRLTISPISYTEAIRTALQIEGEAPVNKA